MELSTCSLNNSNQNNENHNCREILMQYNLQNPNQFQSQQSFLCQKNEEPQQTQKQLSQQSKYHDDINLKLQDFNENNYSENEIIPSNKMVIQMRNEQCFSHNNSNHLSNQSQYNIQTKFANDYYDIIGNYQMKESYLNFIKQQGSKCDEQIQNKSDNNIEDQIESQYNKSFVDEEDEIPFQSIQYESQEANSNSNISEKNIQKNIDQIQYDQQLGQEVSLNCQNDNLFNINGDDSPINSIYEHDILKQTDFQNRQESFCESILNQSIGNINGDERMQLKIVNEILNYEDQKLNRTISLNQSCKNSSQFLNQSLIDGEIKIGNKTIQNIIQTTKYSSDISNLMANIELTEQNVNLLDELNILNQVIKEFEENIEILSKQHDFVNQQYRQQKTINNNIPTISQNNIDELQDKNWKTNQLKEMIIQRKQHLKSLNKNLIKIESEREQQKQKESIIIKKVDKDFEQDVDLMSQGLREINNLKQEVTHDMQEEEEHYHNLQERKSLGKEDLIAKLMQRAELVAQMEDFEEIQEDFKQKFSIEAKYILQQFELKKELERIQIHQQELVDCKKEQQILSDQIHTQILELNEIFAEKQNSINDIQSQKSQQNRILDDKMKTIEEQINKKCISIGLESGETLFQNIFNERNMTLSRQAIQKQVELIEKEELNLNEQYIQDMEVIEQRIQNSQFYSSNSSILTSQSPQSSPSQSQRSRFSQTVRQLHDSTFHNSHTQSKQSLSVHQFLQQENNQQQDYISEKQKTQEVFLIRSSMLRKWKEKAREYLTFFYMQIKSAYEFGVNDYNSSNAYDDTLLQNLIRCYFDSSNILFEEPEIDFLTDLYIQYFEALQSQKNLVNERNQDEKDLTSQIEEIEKKIIQLKEAKDLIRCEIQHFDECIQKNSNSLKIKEQEISSKRIIMENILQQQADQAFQDYIEQQSDVFEGLQKTYGNKALQQIKIGHHKQFREIMKENQENRMQKFQEVLICIEKINKNIKVNINYVDSQLSEDLRKVQVEITQSREKKMKLEINYQSILQKEKEFKRQFDSLILSKKVKVNDILNEGSSFTSQHTYEKVKQQLQNDIENSESEINIIETNINDSQRMNEPHFDKLKRLNDKNICLNSQQQLKQIYSNDLPNNQNIIDENQILAQMKKQLDEFQIQKIALESKLIEINFNINPSSSYSKKQVFKNTFIQEKDENNSRSLDIHEYLKNLNNHLEISIPYLDNLSGTFCQSKKGSIAKNINKKIGGEINQKQMKQSNLQHYLIKDSDNQSTKNQFDKSKKVQSTSQKINETCEINSNLLNLSESNNSHKNHSNQLMKLDSSISSFFDNQNSEQIFNKSQNNSSQQLQNPNFHTKQSPQSSYHSETQQNQQKQKNSLENKSQKSIAIINESREENLEFNNIINSQNLLQNNNFNQKQQSNSINENKTNNVFKHNAQNNIQQLNSQKQFIQQNHISNDFQTNILLNQQTSNQIQNNQFQNQNFINGENNSRRNSSFVGNQSQCYQDLDHTLQTITEEQISTNRGLSARNNLQYQGIYNQIQNIQTNNQKYKQPYFNQIYESNQFNNLNVDNIQIVNLEYQNKNSKYKNNSNLQNIQKENVLNRKQQNLTQQQKIIENQLNKTHQNSKLINHIRSQSLNQNPLENQNSSQEEIELKNEQFIQDVSKNMKQQMQQIANISHIQNQFNKYRNNADIQQEDAFLGYNQQQQHFYENQNSKINFYQQENVCPNIRQFSNSCKSSQNQKNIQPIMNNTFHFTDIQKQQVIQNETYNQFTPSSNIEISFNSYLNSSLNISRQMKKNKNRDIENNKSLNNIQPQTLKIHPSKNQENQKNDILNNQIYQYQNQITDSQNQLLTINQSQRFPLQYSEDQNINSNTYLLQNSIQQQPYNPQVNGHDNFNVYSIANYKKRRSKSEEMNNICNTISTTEKSKQEIKIPQTLLTTNRIRSKSQSIYQNQLLNKHLQQQLLLQQQQQQHQNQPRTFIFKLHLESLQNKEAQFLVQIKELLEGSLILKKFSSHQSLKQNIFNPFTCEQMPPENCGFGLRVITLHKNLTKIEIRHPLKQGTVESTINVDQILRHQIPNTTAELIKLQKYNEPRTQKDLNLNSMNRNINFGQEHIDQIQYYSFSIVLDKGGRVDFIAQNYKTFNMWLSGLQQLIKLKKQLPRLKNHIEQIQII